MDGLPYNSLEDQQKFLKEEYSEERLKKIKQYGSIFVDGYHSKYLGKHPYRISTRKQTFYKPSLDSRIFQANHQHLFDINDVNVSKCVVTKGCYHTNKSTLIAQLIPQEETVLSGLPSTEAMKILEPHVMNVLRKLQIETIATPVKSDMCKVGYNSKTYPGFHYDAYGDMRTKTEAIIDAFKIASKRWDRIEKGKFKREEIFPSLYAIGARNKRDYTYEEGE